jgi:hypothetical protein
MYLSAILEKTGKGKFVHRAGFFSPSKASAINQANNRKLSYEDEYDEEFIVVVSSTLEVPEEKDVDVPTKPFKG